VSLILQDTYGRPPTGDFLLHVFHRGILIEEIDEKNLIVNNSKLIHARLLGGDVLNRPLAQIGFGTNPTPPAAGNTTLTSAFLKPLDGVSYPSDSQVRFAFSLGPLEANGMAISEFGLLTGVGMLYARKVRSAPLNKDSDLSFAGTWTINF